MVISTQYPKALALLEKPETYPGLAERSRSLVLLRIWRFPSFQPFSSWGVIQVKKDLFLRRITWNQRHSLGSEPVTYGSEVPLPQSEFNKILSDLRAIELAPFIAVATAGIDGTSYGIEVGGFGVSAKLNWWETPPVNWDPLHQWHANAIAHFEALLPASTLEIDHN